MCVRDNLLIRKIFSHYTKSVLYCAGFSLLLRRPVATGPCCRGAMALCCFPRGDGGREKKGIHRPCSSTRSPQPSNFTTTNVIYLSCFGVILSSSLARCKYVADLFPLIFQILSYFIERQITFSMHQGLCLSFSFACTLFISLFFLLTRSKFFRRVCCLTVLRLL